MKTNLLISIPYKIIAIILVSAAILTGAVFAIGIPANVIYLFQ